MSILYDDAQQAMAREARRAVDGCADKARLLALLETTGEHDAAFWNVAVDQGWTMLAVPQAFGGLGLGLIELGIVAEAAGSQPAGAPFLNTGFGVASALLASGHDAAQTRWLPGLASGECIGAVAFGEGNEALPAVPATRFSGGLLTGHKPGVPAGLQADCTLVWATGDAGPVLVLADMAGVGREAVRGFDNSRGHAGLTFSATPATLLAQGDDARRLALDVLARMAVVAAHEQLGGAQALLLIGRDHALARKAFGQPIGAFQSVKHRLAELYGLVEIARANAIHAAACEGRGDFLRAAAAARLSATEAYDTAVRDVVQIHGGIGVTWEGGLHLHTRRARSLAVELGNALFWEDVLVAELVASGLGPTERTGAGA